MIERRTNPMNDRRTSLDAQKRIFDMRSLMRLAIWGGAAASALLLTVVIVHSNSSSQQMLTATSRATDAQASASARSERGPRALDTPEDARRLAEVLQSLAGDRDRILLRITALERSLEDVTGSIRREAAFASTPQPGPPNAPALPSGAAAAPQRDTRLAQVGSPPVKDQEPLPSTQVSQHVPTPRQSEPAQAQIGASAGTTGTTGTAEAPPPEPVTEPEAVKSGPEIGIELGGAPTFDAVRNLWSLTKRANGKLFDRMTPVVAVRESKNSGVELRLIAGPLASLEAAARVCAALTVGNRSCQLVPYVGQPLQGGQQAQAAREQERPSERKSVPAKPSTVSSHPTKD